MYTMNVVDVQPQQLHHKVWPKTYFVNPDEKALLLIERDEMSPDSRGWRRYQTIFVARNDALAKYMEDMGPAELFIAGALDIPGGDPANPMGQWEETVGDLKDYANEFREWLALRRMTREVPDLINGFYDQVEIDYRERHRISQAGPYYRVERG